MAKGDFVEVLVDAGGGAAKEYVVRANKAGRRVEVKTSRSTVEISELTRTGGIVTLRGLEDWAEMRRIAGPERRVRSVALSSDRKLMAGSSRVAGNGRGHRLWADQA